MSGNLSGDLLLDEDSGWVFVGEEYGVISKIDEKDLWEFEFGVDSVKGKDIDLFELVWLSSCIKSWVACNLWKFNTRDIEDDMALEWIIVNKDCETSISKAKWEWDRDSEVRAIKLFI